MHHSKLGIDVHYAKKNNSPHGLRVPFLFRQGKDQTQIHIRLLLLLSPTRKPLCKDFPYFRIYKLWEAVFCKWAGF